MLWFFSAERSSLIGAIDDTDRSALLHALNDPNVSDGAVLGALSEVTGPF
jgi:hypothetical protein